MNKNYSSETDQKLRFGGILENPYISRIHRHCLDGFKVTGLANILKPYYFASLLDVGCGIGEYSHVRKGSYVGVDNSYSRVLFGKRQYKGCHFVQADAVRLPFKDKSFEAVLLANTAHHLSDENLIVVMEEMKRVSRKYLIVDDCVVTPDQTPLSKYFYSLDRGTRFRSVPEFRVAFAADTELRLVKQDMHLTFPGLYWHAVFVLEVNNT